ncbi:MAG: polysaccharide deacetylase family protein [Actinomycetota bacterium]|nr:polysaccharide deacetylase family protein [Actinomycetota bacterium]
MVAGAVKGEPHANLRVTTSARLVGLSFDDGPTVADTPYVLGLLADAHARATFFDVGRFAALHPALVRRELRAGHEVANHTYDHIALTHAEAHSALRVPERTITREIALDRSALCRAGAPDPKLFRPPYGRGVFNREIEALAVAQGERIIGWDLALEHYIDNARPLPSSVAALLARVRPGSIILAHDGPGSRQRTITALPLLLGGLKRLGYRAVSITTLLRSNAVARSG